MTITLQNPEYTGENRCWPCTVTKTLIGAMIAGGATVVLGWEWGLLALVVSVAAIWSRGYLVPGTPTLTRRYFPPWLLSLFGKAPSPSIQLGQANISDDDRSKRDVLLEHDVVTRRNGDLRLSSAVEDRLGTAAAEIVDDLDAAMVADRFAIDDDQLVLNEGVDGARILENGEAFDYVKHWPSPAALAFDVAAAEVLGERDEEWPSITAWDRLALAQSVRLFVEECPRCGSEVEPTVDELETCCSTHQSTVADCPDCEARLFEVT